MAKVITNIELASEDSVQEGDHGPVYSQSDSNWKPAWTPRQIADAIMQLDPDDAYDIFRSLGKSLTAGIPLASLPPRE